MPLSWRFQDVTALRMVAKTSAFLCSAAEARRKYRSRAVDNIMPCRSCTGGFRSKGPSRVSKSYIDRINTWRGEEKTKIDAWKIGDSEVVVAVALKRRDIPTRTSVRISDMTYRRIGDFQEKTMTW
jgi:hypothetical protein